MKDTRLFKHKSHKSINIHCTSDNQNHPNRKRCSVLLSANAGLGFSEEETSKRPGTTKELSVKL